MVSPLVVDLIAADRIAERQRYAATARLAAIARCCRPSTWARAVRSLARAATRLSSARSTSTLCCAAA